VISFPRPIVEFLVPGSVDVIGKEVAHYKILDRLGGGGMGVVYKAEDTRLGRTVALKFLNLELLANDSVRRRFLHEARAASSIDHPNVCHVYEVGEADDGRFFMAMSYCEGRSLRDVIHEGSVAPREAFSIAFGIAQGLWAAHRRGIVHRDIKPGNVILTDEGFVRIVDFGLALLIGDSRVTTSGVTVGTVAYMSPEQTSDSTVGANTDIWSLGVTLYELLTGRLPFRGDVNAALVYSIVHEPHTPLPDSVPAPCARIVDRCLEKDPAKRYQTIEELLEDMVKAAQELGWESSMASATIAPILRARRRRIVTRRVAVIAATLLVVAGGWFAWQRYHIRSPYTTKVRLAVLPLTNMIGSGNDAFVDGLSEHLSRVARGVSREHASMWTVPYLSVVNADLAKPTDARTAFGANRVLTGDVQRFKNAYRLNLRLLDTKNGHVINEGAIPFELTRPTALNDSVIMVTSKILGVPQVDATRSPLYAHDARAIPPYLEAMSLLRAAGTKGPLDRAVALIDSSVTFDSTYVPALCLAGNVDLQLNRRQPNAALLSRALASGRAARSHSASFADAWILLGDVFQRTEQPDSVQQCYASAVAAEPRLLFASQRLGSFYTAHDRLAEAEELYHQYIARCPDLWGAYMRLGLFYYDQKRIDDAAAAWEKGLAVAPGDPLTLNNLGAVYHRRGEWPRARALFLRSFKAKPDCDSSSNVAVTHYFEGNYAEAAKYFQFALEYCDTTQDGPWADLARALYWTNDGRPRSITLYKKALRLAESALNHNPDDVDLMASVIDYQAMVEHADTATAMIERIKPLLKDNERAMYRVGTVEEKLGHREAALDLLGDAVRHGFPVPELRGDPMLKSLMSDSRFQQMVSTEVAADGAQAAGNRR
jgi:eukaryotic-like serine/threonine-protein kinase